MGKIVAYSYRLLLGIIAAIALNTYVVATNAGRDPVWIASDSELPAIQTGTQTPSATATHKATTTGIAASHQRASHTVTPEQLGYHYIVVDEDGNILPWYQPGNLGASYNHIMRLVFEWWLDMERNPSEPDLPYYLMHQVWRGPPFYDPRGLGGDQIAMAMSSWRLLYGYSGDPRTIDDMVRMADHVLAAGLSSSSDEWPDIPYPYNYTSLDHYDGDMVFGAGVTQPDKAGSFGYELLNLYKINENGNYLQAAIRIANTLASKTQIGDLENSPLPYRVNAVDGTVVASYTTNFSALLMLWDGLVELGQGDTQEYQDAHAILINWLKNYPIPYNKWGPFFEDVAGWSDTQINAVTLAMYIMEHRQTWGTTWQADARAALDWAINVLGNDNWIGYGVQVIDEQTVYRAPGNSHTSRQASMELFYAELSGDTTYVQNALRQLNWATYMVDFDGKNRYLNNDIWLTDGYGDYVRHYLRSMASAPLLAPDDQDHLLRSSAIIQEITYQENLIRYRTWNNDSQELFRINTFVPDRVTADGVSLPRLEYITDLENLEGYTLGAPGDLPSVLRVHHVDAHEIVIVNSSGFPPTPTATVTATATQTATQTPTATATMTATPTIPAPEYQIYLPLIIREVYPDTAWKKRQAGFGVLFWNKGVVGYAKSLETRVSKGDFFIL